MSASQRRELSEAKGQRQSAQSRARESAAEWVPVGELVPWVKNPRKNDAAVKAVADAIKRFGFGAPIIARRENGEVIAGHTRLKAALSLGLETVPVRYMDLDPVEAHLLALADNRLNEKAEWDLPALQDIMGEYGLADLDLAGWSSTDIEKMGSDLLGRADDAPVEEVEMVAPPTDAVTRMGDVWSLGSHRLVCGDSTQREVWEALLGHERADCVWTDPPYGVAYVGKTKDALTIENDALDEDGLRALLDAAFDNAVAFTKPGAGWYVAVPPGPLHLTFAQALHERGVLRQTLIWVKDQFVMGRSDYHYRHEPILYGWSPGGKHHFVDDRTLDSVLEFARPRQNKEHPTMKPIELVAYCVRNSSNRGDIVMEPFGGSGTTLLACEQTGRINRSIELSPVYCDVIVQRWEKLTGGKATRG
jgi:site-specific DNA-methyltransferase (adenine-specific)